MKFTHLVFDGLQFVLYSVYAVPVKYLSVLKLVRYRVNVVSIPHTARLRHGERTRWTVFQSSIFLSLGLRGHSLIFVCENQ